MQRGKRFLSLLLAMVMLLGMAMPAMAAPGDATVTFNVGAGTTTDTTSFTGLDSDLTMEENGVTAPTVTPAEGFTFTGWEPAFDTTANPAVGENTFVAQFEATTTPEATTTNTVNLHKLLMDDATMDGWNVNGPEGYDGTQDTTALGTLAGVTLKEIAGVYFAVQNADGAWIDASGTVVTTVEEALGGLTTATGLAIDTSALPQEPTVYKIVEVRELSTYVGDNGETLSRMLAVPVEITLPLVNQDGIQETVHVYPKNTEVGLPDNDKTFGDDASAEIKDGKVDVGETVPYKVTTTIQAGSTYNKLAWTDKMSAGLTFNQDVVITSNPDLALTDTDYTIDYSDPTGFVLVLTDSGLKKLAEQTAPTDAEFKVNGEGDPINGLNTAVTFTLVYSAVVNEDAVINNPLENTNSLHYGNNPGYTPEPGDKNPPEFPNVTEITVNKSFTDGPTAASPTITWPEGLVIQLNLQVYNPSTNEWEDLAAQATTLNAAKTSHTFTGLDDSKVYKVVESPVNGWVPNYELQEDGTLKIVNKKNDNPEPITPEPVIVRTGGKKFVKTSLDATERLAGAKFVVIDEAGKYLALKSDAQTGNEITDYKAAEEAYIAAVDAYNALPEDERTQEMLDNIATLRATRDAAYAAMNMQWTWVADEGDAFVFTTNEEGQWSVEGLAYGSYQFKEIKAPEGYADQLTPVGFTIDANSYTTGDIDYVADEVDGNEDATQITNKKVTIPQTGGIGTIIFTVGGIALMGGAAIAMKKNKEEDEE